MRTIIVVVTIQALVSAPIIAYGHGGGRGGGGGGGGGYHAPAAHESFHAAPHESFHSSVAPHEAFHAATFSHAGGESFAHEHGFAGEHGFGGVGGVGGVGHVGGPGWAGAGSIGHHEFAGYHPGVGGIWGGGHYHPNYYGNWYHGNWYGHYGNAWGSWPAGWGYGYGYHGGWGLGLGVGLGLGAAGLMAATSPWNWGYYGYNNPYWNSGYGGGMSYINYSQPIIASAPVYPPGQYGAGYPAGQYASDPNYAPGAYAGGTAYPPGQQFAAGGQPIPGGQQYAGGPGPTVAAGGGPGGPSAQAIGIFDGAREQFIQGNYQAALDQVNQALALSPNESVMHEFRALCLFAQGNYGQSAAAVYAVLATGPGWDWTTMSALYPNQEVYNGQLQALENYRLQNPQAADARFLLAYHYLREGHNEQAANELKAVVALQPKDQLAAQMLQGLTTPASGPGTTPPPSTPAAPSTPINPAALVGNWQASRSDGSKFNLSLSPDGKFTWKYAQQNQQPQEMAGTYTAADNYLILKAGDQNSLIGQVASQGGNGFNFKLAGDNPADPGLAFTR